VHGVAEEERANAARVYDDMLGGAHNLGSDRDTARALLADDPGLELLPPGLVDVTAWPAFEQREPVGVYAAVARVP
jgi:hypothetical protein